MHLILKRFDKAGSRNSMDFWDWCCCQEDRGISYRGLYSIQIQGCSTQTACQNWKHSIVSLCFIKNHIKSQYYVAIRIHVCIKCSMIMTWIPVIVVNTGYQHCIMNFLDWYCLLVSIHVHINGRTFLLSIIYRFQCLFHSAEKLLDVIKRSVPSEDADDENPVVTVYLSELFVKTQPNMTKSVSKYTCQIFF